MDNKVLIDQAVLFHFACKKNDRVYQIILQPGAPWAEITEVLEDFKLEFQKLEQQALEAEKNRNQDAAPIAVEAENSVVEPVTDDTNTVVE